MSFGLSEGARAFISDPANHDTRAADPSLIPSWRAEALAAAEAAAPGILAATGCTTEQAEIGGRPALEIIPPAEDSTPILYIYGGGFYGGSPLEDLAISAVLAAETGARVISPTYRLAPEDPFPAGLDDVTAAMAAMAAAGRYQVAAESAGGNLALVAVARMLARGLPGPEQLACMSPAGDLTGHYAPWEEGCDPLLSTSQGRMVPELYAPGLDRSTPEISPVNLSFGPDWPPTLITTGTRDLLAGMCARLSRAMRVGGAPVELRLWDGMWHVFEAYPVPEAKASLSEIAAFLRAG
ncbi:MAG: alpha/beta hydrolase fold domain-containing protein [Pseudomonadota bacterium]